MRTFQLSFFSLLFFASSLFLSKNTLAQNSSANGAPAVNVPPAMNDILQSQPLPPQAPPSTHQVQTSPAMEPSAQTTLPAPAPVVAPPPTDAAFANPSSAAPTASPQAPQFSQPAGSMPSMQNPNINISALNSSGQAEMRTNFALFVGGKTEILPFATNDDCKNLARTFKSCTKATCKLSRMVNGTPIESFYEVHGWMKSKCSYSYFHLLAGAPEMANTKVKCELNKSQLNQLSNLFQITLTGEAVAAETSECIGNDETGKSVIKGECNITIKDKKILDVEKLSHFWGQCK